MRAGWPAYPGSDDEIQELRAAEIEFYSSREPWDAADPCDNPTRPSDSELMPRRVKGHLTLEELRQWEAEDRKDRPSWAVRGTKRD